MSRRPRRSRPPRLDGPYDPSVGSGSADGDAARAGARPERSTSARRALLAARLTGPHARLGGEAVRHAARLVAQGDHRARLGCDDLRDSGIDEVRAALVKTHGWEPEASRAAIDPDATLAALRAAGTRLRDAATGGARIAVASARPASLLGVAQWVAQLARECGATVLTADRATIDGGSRRELWWVGDVAVVTDGRSLLAHDALAGGDDWLFAVGRPDLVVADRGFAGAALRAGVDTIAWADLDVPALSLAAARGLPILVVPLDDARPAPAYDAAIAVLARPDAPPV